MSPGQEVEVHTAKVFSSGCLGCVLKCRNSHKPSHQREADRMLLSGPEVTSPDNLGLFFSCPGSMLCLSVMRRSCELFKASQNMRGKDARHLCQRELGAWLGLFRAPGLWALRQDTAACHSCKMSLLMRSGGKQAPYQCFRNEESVGAKVNRELSPAHCTCL